MKKIINYKKFSILFILILTIIPTNLLAEVNFFNEGKKLFDNKNFKKSKFKFEQDIVFNPKNENSYLYLAKIYLEEDNDDLQEINLNTVVLLNPKNEEAIYLLTLLNIKKSNFSKAEDLIINFADVCKKLCKSKKNLKEKLKNSLN
mgnify:FL=1